MGRGRNSGLTGGLESLRGIAQSSNDKYDFWTNLNDTQQTILMESGMRFDDVYEMLRKGKRKRESEWAEANPGSASDFSIKFDFSKAKSEFVPIEAKSDGWMAEAGTAGRIYVRNDGIPDWEYVITHELGHQLSSFSEKLQQTIALNPGGIFGRYNTRLNKFSGIYGEYNPEEAFADSVSEYVRHPTEMKKTYPEAYKAIDNLFKASPSARKFVDGMVKEYRQKFAR